MSLIFLNLKKLWQEERRFFLMIVLVQVFSVFGMLLITGVMINNYNVSREDKYSTLQISISFSDDAPVTYGEFEKAAKVLLSEHFDSAQAELQLTSVVLDERFEMGCLMVCSFASVNDGKYVIGTTLSEVIEPQIIEGVNLTDDDLNSDEGKAIVYDYNFDSLSLNDEEFEIIGERYVKKSDGLPVVIVPPGKMADMELSSCVISTDKLITNHQKNMLSNMFEETVPGRYSIVFPEESDADKEALSRAVTTACALIIISVMGTLAILYQYIMEKRMYFMAILQVAGCNKFKTFLILLGEMSILSIVSIGMGTVLFYIAQQWILTDVYKYMLDIMTPVKILSVVSTMILFVFVIFIIVALKTSKVEPCDMLRESER